MPAPRVASINLAPFSAKPESGERRVVVNLEGGRASDFLAAAYDRPAAWIAENPEGVRFSEPVLYLARVDEATVRRAVDAMASDMGGFWLRYYNSAPPKSAGTKVGLGTAAMALPEGSVGWGVVEAVLKDGREFSMLAATPAWFESQLRALGSFYYGPSVLLLKKLDGAHAKRAAKAMAERDEQLFCRYDTPRRTLPEVLAAFKSSHS